MRSKPWIDASWHDEAEEFRVYHLPWPAYSNNFSARRWPDPTGYRQAVRCEVWSRQYGPPLEGPCEIRLVLTPPNARRHDVDNVTKPLFDALVKAGAVLDDSQFKRGTWEFLEPPKLLTKAERARGEVRAGRVVVAIRPLGG